MKHFHAHIYFKPSSLEQAHICKANAEQSEIFEIVKFYEKAVGPHARGMIEAHFSEPICPAAIAWLEANRGEFSVLIHQDTGDDVKDHTDGIRWLGEVLPIDFDFFELILSRPDLRINPL